MRRQSEGSFATRGWPWIAGAGLVFASLAVFMAYSPIGERLVARMHDAWPSAVSSQEAGADVVGSPASGIPAVRQPGAGSRHPPGQRQLGAGDGVATTAGASGVDTGIEGSAGHPARGPTRSEADDPAEEPPATLAIAGTVMDDRGVTLAGIAVVATPFAVVGGRQGALSRMTDRQGMFVFEPLSEGEYELAAMGSEQYRPGIVRVRAGVENAEIRLQRVGEVQVSGRVADQLDGTPLEGVRISVLGQRQVTTASGALGEYALAVPRLRAGTASVLEFRHDGYRPLRLRVNEPEAGNGPVVLDALLDPSGDLAWVQGQVRDDLGQPVEAVPVWLRSSVTGVFQRVLSDEQGRFRFDGVETGSGYRLGTDRMGDYAEATTPPFEIIAPGVGRDLQVALQTYGSLAGRVVGPDGGPLPGMALWLHNGGAQAREAQRFVTDGNGEFEVQGVPAGPLRIETRSQPLLQASGIQLEAGERRTVVVPLDWGPHWLMGRVVDEGGHPVPQARAVLQWSSPAGGLRSVSRREVGTDSEGYFAFSNLGAGIHVLTVEAVGYQRLRSEHDPARTGRELRIALERQKTADKGG